MIGKFGNTAVKTLKSALLDYYDDGALSAAKRQLLKDVDNIKLQVGIDSLPHVPLRREGDHRVQREVDDIFTILNALDERSAVSKLPTYVTDGPDKMPSTRLYEGDFCAIMGILEKMDNRLNTLGSALSAISRDVYALRSKSTEGSVGQLSLSRGAINKKAAGQAAGPEVNIASLEAWPRLPETTCLQSGMTSYEGSGAHPAASHAASMATAGTTTNAHFSDVSSVPVGESRWSVLASTPQGSSNRFAVLASTDDDGNHDERPYQLVRRQRSVRSAAKRQRQQSAAQDTARQSSQPADQPRTRAVTGQSSVVNLALRAAKKTIKKAVFCVDNVDLACNEDDIRAHVSSLGVEVFSCFKTNPRRRPHESAEDVSDRRAFRLCVNAANRDRLLNPDVWPDSIRIGDWFFNSKNDNQENQEKRLRINGSGQRGVVVASRSSDGAGADVQQGSVEENQINQREINAAAPVTTAASAVAMDTVSTGNDVGDEQDGAGDQTTIYQYGEC